MRLRIEGLSWREIDDDLVILDLESSKYLTANRSAAILMKLLTNDRTVEEMVAALVDSFGIAHATAEKDVSEFVELLARHKMLESA